VLLGSGSATGRSSIQRSPTKCGVSVIKEPHGRGLDNSGLSSREKTKKIMWLPVCISGDS
jgi:hypothetical protein